MKSRSSILTALGLAAAMFAGGAMAGGIPHPGKGYGHGQSKHYSPGHGYGHRYERRYDHGRQYGYDRYRHRSYGHGYYRGPARVVRYSRYEVHHHGPYCGHSGYTRSWSRGYSPYYGQGYRRDYGRAAFSGHDDGVGYYIEFDY